MSKTPLEPVVLFGAERSGTTLLRLMLDGHSQISWAPELDFILESVEAPFSNEGIRNYTAQLRRMRIFQDLSLEIREVEDFEGLLRDLFFQVRSQSRKEIFGLTLHASLQSFYALFPSARYIHLVRDPRDVAKSCMEMGWDGNLWSAVERWQRAEAEWQDFKKQISPEDFIEIRFEDLISKCSETLKSLCEFLNVEFEAGLLSYPDRTTYKVPDPSRSSPWMVRFSSRDHRYVEARAGSLMDLRGYSRKHPKANVSFLEARYLTLQNRIYRIYFRLRRMGLLLFGLDFLNRRIFSRRLDGWLLPRIHSNERRFLR